MTENELMEMVEMPANASWEPANASWKPVQDVPADVRRPQGRPQQPVVSHPEGRPTEPMPLLAKRLAPLLELKKERPAHRLALELAAQGYNITEIAQRLGVTTVSVQNWLRQDHAQQTLVDTIHRNITEDEQVVEIIKRNVVKAVTFYENVLADSQADRKDRMEAAERLLNRRYGKPTQPMAQGKVVDLNDLSDDELAQMLQPTSGTATS